MFRFNASTFKTLNNYFLIEQELNLLHGAHNWSRTSDLFPTKKVLYRLSYMGAPNSFGAGEGNRTLVVRLEI